MAPEAQGTHRYSHLGAGEAQKQLVEALTQETHRTRTPQEGRRADLDSAPVRSALERSRVFKMTILADDEEPLVCGNVKGRSDTPYR